MIVVIADFICYWALNINTANTPVLQDYIDRYEKLYIRRLLGVELGNLFIDNYENDPSQEARFAVIEDPFQLSLNDCDHESLGLKQFLMAGIFKHYVEDKQKRVTDNGVAASKDEAEDISSWQDAARLTERKWNEHLDTADAIQWYCKTYAPAKFPEDEDRLYPEFNGKKQDAEWSALL